MPALQVTLLPPPRADARDRLREALRRAAHDRAAEAYDLPASAWRGRIVDVVA
jgi:hypothetical protein